MSRVQLHPKNPADEVVVGLDEPLNTFFISVVRDGCEFPVEFQHRWDRSDVIEKIREYAVDNERTQKVVSQIFLDMDPAQAVPEKLP